MDDYASRFLKLRIKVDRNNVILVEYVMLKFIQGLKSQIMSLVYIKNSIIVNTMIIVIRHIEEELELMNENK